MTTEFRKDLSHLTWQEVFVRQHQRAALVPAWCEALHLKAGSHVLDLGAGPGYVSLQMAHLVGPTGLVYAVDREGEALAYLAEVMQRHSRSCRSVASSPMRAHFTWKMSWYQQCCSL
jgi:16S rRNA C967 or C1407 C5-methylase (RsmB/RsmF family)